MDGFGKWFFFAIVCYCCCALCESLERSEWTRLMASPSGALFLPRLYIEIKLIAQTVLSIFRSAYSKRGYLQFNIKRASLAEYDNTVKWEGETGISFFGCWESYRQTKPNRRRRRICPLSYSFSLFIIIIPLLYFNPPEYERILSVYFSYTIHES